MKRVFLVLSMILGFALTTNCCGKCKEDCQKECCSHDNKKCDENCQKECCKDKTTAEAAE